MQAEFVLLRVRVGLALSGVAFLHFLLAQVVLGIGWNFAFIAAWQCPMATIKVGCRSDEP